MLRIFHCIFWVRAFLRHYYYYYFSTSADFRHTEFKTVLFFNSEWQYRWKDANICIFCCFHYENGKKLCTVFLPSFWQNYTYDIVLDFVFCSITVVIKWTLFLTNWYPLDSCFWRWDLFILTDTRNSHNDFSNKEWDQTYCVRHLNFKCHSLSRLSRLELWKPDEGKPVQQRLGTLISKCQICAPHPVFTKLGIYAFVSSYLSGFLTKISEYFPHKTDLTYREGPVPGDKEHLLYIKSTDSQSEVLEITLKIVIWGCN